MLSAADVEGVNLGEQSREPKALDEDHGEARTEKSGSKSATVPLEQYNTLKERFTELRKVSLPCNSQSKILHTLRPSKHNIYNLSNFKLRPESLFSEWALVANSF